MSLDQNDREAIEAFGRQLGLSARPGPGGTYAFRFAEDGVVTLAADRDGTRVCMTLERPGPHRADTQRRALSAAGYDPALSTLLHVSSAPEGSLLFTIALQGGRISLPDIETGLQALLTKARD